jgi:hypothetical protein
MERGNASLFVYVDGRRQSARHRGLCGRKDAGAADHRDRGVEGVVESIATVALAHATEYAIGVYNHDDDRDVDARIEIDGKLVIVVRVGRRSEVRINRPSIVGRRLTFYDVASDEGVAGKLASVARSDLGLIKCTINFSILPVDVAYDEVDTTTTILQADDDVETDGGGGGGGARRGEGSRPSAVGERVGGTALGAPSKQSFVAAPRIEYDPTLTVTLRARLVLRVDEPEAAVIPL